MSGTEATKGPADLEANRNSKDRTCAPGSPPRTVLVMAPSQVSQCFALSVVSLWRI